jgi:cell division protein FtsA
MSKNNKLYIDLSSNKINYSLQINGNSHVEDSLIGDGIDKGLITNLENLTTSIKNNLKLLNIIKNKDFDEVIFGISPSNIDTESDLHLIFNLDSPRAINESDVSQLENITYAKENDSSIIHSYPLGFILDSKDTVINPLGMHARKFESKILKIIIDSGLNYNLKGLAKNLDIGTPFQIVSNNLANSLYSVEEENKEVGCYLINVGNTVTELSAIYRNKVRYLKAIPVGSEHFITDISLTLDISLSDANLLVSEFGTMTPELIKEKESRVISSNTGEELVITNRKIGAIMRERANELLTISKNLFNDWELRDFPINRVVISGKGSRHEGFESLVKYVFQYFIYKSTNIQDSSIISLKNLDSHFKELYMSNENSASKNTNFNLPSNYNSLTKKIGLGKLKKALNFKINSKVKSGG